MKEQLLVKLNLKAKKIELSKTVKLQVRRLILIKNITKPKYILILTLFSIYKPDFPRQQGTELALFAHNVAIFSFSKIT
jgi:hypothetical protein